MHYSARRDHVTESGPVRSILSTPADLAVKVRDLRRQRGLSRQALAAASGLSVRYLARVEGGDGNLSLLRLDALARALGTTADALIRSKPAAQRLVMLVGLRGAGKSTVGPLVAEQLGVPFVELDERITSASGLSAAEIFELHGERYYRRAEGDSLRRLIEAGEPAIIAAAGGIVEDAETWALARERTTVVWLRARPEEHWSRVVAQGDRRPMGDNPEAMDELRDLLRSREPLYARAALAVDTSGRSPQEVAGQIVEALGSFAVVSG